MIEEGAIDTLLDKNISENTTLIRLSNGSTIVGEKKRETRTVSLGFAFMVGSANESETNRGISHFIEHILFKGTESRSALEIKEPIERVGGSLNAYTGRISTVYYAKVPDIHGELALEILHDLIHKPMFLNDDIDLERNVILEELASAQDDPYDRIYDMTVEKVWDEDFGHSILGSEETVKAITKKDLEEYYRTFYRANRLVFGIAGNYSDDLFEKAKKLIGEFPGNDSKNVLTKSPSIFNCPLHIIEKRKDLQQVHLLLSKEAPGRSNQKDFQPFVVFNTLFGNGMSSILFHNIREKLGMVYNIDSEFISYRDSGTFLISACTNPKNLSKLLMKLKDELTELKVNGVSLPQFKYGKERLKGRILMSTEGTLPTLSRNLDDLVICDESKTLEQTVKDIDKCSIEDLNTVIKSYLTGKWNLSLLIPESSEIVEETSFEV